MYSFYVHAFVFVRLEIFLLLSLSWPCSEGDKLDILTERCLVVLCVSVDMFVGECHCVCGGDGAVGTSVYGNVLGHTGRKLDFELCIYCKTLYYALKIGVSVLKH